MISFGSERTCIIMASSQTISIFWTRRWITRSPRRALDATLRIHSQSDHIDTSNGVRVWAWKSKDKHKDKSSNSEIVHDDLGCLSVPCVSYVRIPYRCYGGVT